MPNFLELVKKSFFIVGFNIAPYYAGKNWSKIEKYIKYNKLPITIHK
jgi:hypothetical protein